MADRLDADGLPTTFEITSAAGVTSIPPIRGRTTVLAAAFAMTAVWTVAPASAAARSLTYVVHEPVDKVGHPPLIVLLHGSGADERDMIGLWSGLPRDFVVVSPRAPFADGAGGFRWYRRAAASRASDVDLSRAVIDTLVDDAIKRFDADPKRIFLAGFSQGAVMTYDVALREPGRFRGAAVLSGSLLPGERAHVPAAADRTQESFFVAHGTLDDRIPFTAARSARAELGSLGIHTAFHAYPGMRHAIGDAETADLSRWLSDRSATDGVAPR